eukprot:4136069-Amphidinium_carterae.1
MRTANGFEAWRQLNLHYAGGHRAQQFSLLRQIMSPQWNADKHFTKQYYRWLEDINATRVRMEPLRTTSKSRQS